MATLEQERLWLSMAEQHLAQLDSEIKASERRFKDLNDTGYFADDQMFEDAMSTMASARAQMRAHRRQVSNRLEALGGAGPAQTQDSPSFAYRSALNVRRTGD